MTIQLTCKRHFTETSSKMHLIKCRRTDTETISSATSKSVNTHYITQQKLKKNKPKTKPKQKATEDRHHFGQIQTHLMQPDCWTDLIAVHI